MNNLTSSIIPNIWWVNQGETYEIEKKEGIIWAPLLGKGGRQLHHWETMKEVKQGDIIIHYSKGAIRNVSKALKDVMNAPKPESMGASSWNVEGRLVRVEYAQLDPIIPRDLFIKELSKLDISQGPIHSGLGVNQGYLFRFTAAGLNLIKRLTPTTNWPDYTNIAQSDIDPVPPNVSVVERKVRYVNEEIKPQLAKIHSYIHHQGFRYPKNLLENFYLSLKSKPFVILAGISGTGKTKLVKLFAEAMGATRDNKQFTLIPVRPDWSDPSDLLGYKDLSGIFRAGPLTHALLEASKSENRHKPYFICLDEMNLARVEHYFSDMLSILETQKREGDRIATDALLSKDTLSTPTQPIETDLTIPDNVYIIGTVNMDETTHPFSKKVLDRANTIEFNYIQLDNYPEEVHNLEGGITSITNSFLRSDFLQLKDAYNTEHQDLIHQTTEKLVEVNRILEEIHSHIGFRVRDAICFYMIYNRQFSLMTDDQAFDTQLLQKLLPRIQGSSRSVKRVLLNLLNLCVQERLSVEQLLDDASELLEKWRPNVQEPAARYPESARKLVYMLRRLEEDGFTSFWLS